MLVTVMDWERKLLYRDGRFQRVLAPGRHRVGSRKRHTTLEVDLRPRIMHVTGQELLTLDALSLRLSVAATWAVTDPQAFVMGAKNSEHVLYGRIQDSVRAVVAAARLDDLLADRAALLTAVAERLTGEIPELGLHVSAAVVRDLMLPGELRKAALETVLARERGKADLERARSEAAALRSLANTARLLEEHPSLLHLRTLQTAATTPGTRIVLDSRATPADG
ncbi:slipin family protein [Actinocorallia herbida]|nr:slipin family protein [Actinocorallia herbida]